MLVHLLVAALAQSAFAHMPDMVVVDLGVDVKPGTLPTHRFLIPNHDRRSLMSTIRGEKGQFHSFIVDDLTVNFNCQAGSRDCVCSMEARHTSDSESRTTKDACSFNAKRDGQGRCLVDFTPSSKPTLDSFGRCNIRSPRSLPETPQSLQSTVSRVLLVPKQPVAWAVTIGEEKLAIKCGTVDTCDCAIMTMPTSTTVSYPYVSCSSETPPLRDSKGNCRVSYERSAAPSSSASISCKTLDDTEVEKSLVEYFRPADEGLKVLETLPTLDESEKESLHTLQENLSLLKKDDGSSITRRDLTVDELDVFMEHLTLEFQTWGHRRLLAMNSILTEVIVEASDLKSWKDKTTSWEQQSEKLTLEGESTEHGLKESGKLLLEISDGIRELILKVQDQLTVFFKSPDFKSMFKAALPFWFNTWNGIRNLKNQIVH